jgi:hypothetical protein
VLHGASLRRWAASGERGQPPQFRQAGTTIGARTRRYADGGGGAGTGGNRRQDAGAADLEAGTHDIAFVRAADRPSCD